MEKITPVVNKDCYAYYPGGYCMLMKGGYGGQDGKREGRVQCLGCTFYKTVDEYYGAFAAARRSYPDYCTKPKFIPREDYLAIQDRLFNELTKKWSNKKHRLTK